MINPLQFAYISASNKTRNTPVASLARVYAVKTGTINALNIYAVFAPGGAVTFNLLINGVKQFVGAARPVLSAGSHTVSKTGLSISVTKGDLISIDAEVVGLLGFNAPVFFQVDIDDAGEVFSTESIQDLVGAMFQTGSRLIFNYNDSTGKLELDATAPTNEEIQDAVAAALVAGTNVTINYNDGANTITFSSTDTTRTDEEIQDVVAALLVPGTNVTLTYNDAAGSLTIAASGSSSPAATTVTYTTGSLADLAEETGTATIGKTYILIKVSANHACRVRLYSTPAYRTADAARPIGDIPTGEHGVMLDCYLEAANLTLDLSPIVTGANLETSRVSAIPVAIQNKSGGATTIAVTFTYLVLES